MQDNSQQQILGTHSVPKPSISLLVIIDTDSVKQNYPYPSEDLENPTLIAGNMGFMVATATTINSGQGTGDLDLNALVGDTVRAFATSGSDNFEDAVLLCGMSKSTGDDVLSPFNYQNFTKSTIAPESTAQPHSPEIMRKAFWFYQASVIAEGIQGFMVRFTLYTRDLNTGQPALNGYFAWEAKITIRTEKR